MKNFMNHYETLNVSNNASLDEIRASYHSLCKVFHPDLNPHMQDGLLMIEELTNAYEVLKDSNARQDYDVKYLIEMRRKASRPVLQMQEKLPELPPMIAEKVTVKEVVKKEVIKTVVQAPVQALVNDKVVEFSRRSLASREQENGFSGKIAAAIAAVALLGGLALSMSTPNSMISRLRLNSPVEMMSKSNYVRPLLAPNQIAFPEATAYLAGYEQRNNQGHSSVFVDNTKNENDVYLKLLSIEGRKLTAVRHVLIKGKTDFKLENLSAGEYEIQYLDLVSGLAGRSVVFSVEEKMTDFGMKASTLGVRLKTTTNGAMGVENVSIDEFNSLASL